MCLVSHASGEMVEMIARQYSKCSAQAQRIAAHWRKGELEFRGVSRVGYVSLFLRGARAFFGSLAVSVEAFFGARAI
jgi:hypothetical protein